MNLAANENASPAVQSIAMYKVNELNKKFMRKNAKGSRAVAHKDMIKKRLENFIEQPDSFEPMDIPNAPPGSPIGLTAQCSQGN